MANVHKGRVPARRHPGHRDCAPARVLSCLTIAQITECSAQASNGGTEPTRLMVER
jgi:hypothetical protein